MTELVDGLTGSIHQILSASPIVDEGVKEPFKWKVDMGNPDGIIATARHGARNYSVTIDRVKVSITKDTHAEIEAAAKEPTQESYDSQAYAAAEKESVAMSAADAKKKK